MTLISNVVNNCLTILTIQNINANKSQWWWIVSNIAISIIVEKVIYGVQSYTARSVKAHTARSGTNH